jgi:hypothetical protein
MWFLLFGSGVILLGLSGLPWSRRLPAPPPPEALLAGYFLLATLLRLVIRDARLAAFDRKARRLARRQADRPGGPSAATQVGLGVGLGAVQAAGGDFVAAGLTLLAALFRGAAATVSTPSGPARERRRARAREQLRAMACIAGVGLLCAAAAWGPLLRAHLAGAASALAARLR